MSKQSRDVDFTLIGSTKPFSMGASLPASCAQGQMFFLTTATAGQNMHGCTAANIWSEEGGSGGSSSAVWGAITGTLANQGDLNTALGSKPTAALVTSVGTPGLDTNVPSEKAVRTLATAITEGAGTAWGMITGTLSSQTDLSTALGGKQASLGFTPENTANKDAVGGYAGLDSGGHLKTAEAPTWNQSTTGTSANASAWGGITVTGTPTAGWVPIATSSTAAAWGAQSGGGGGGVWGSITGTLSSQTDLNTALAARITASLVTTLGTPGLNTNVPSEEAVRTAIAVGAAKWSQITGTLSAQTDLQAALNTKPTATLTNSVGTPGLATNVPTEYAVRAAIAAIVTGETVGVSVGGTVTGNQPTINFISGTGIIQSCANNAAQTRVDCTPIVDSAVYTSRSLDQAGTDHSLIATSGGAGGTFIAAGAPTLTVYSQNGWFWFVPSDHNCVGSDTLNIGGLGPIAIEKLSAGSLVAVAANDCVLGIPYMIVGVGNPVSAFKITLQ